MPKNNLIRKGIESVLAENLKDLNKENNTPKWKNHFFNVSPTKLNAT